MAMKEAPGVHAGEVDSRSPREDVENLTPCHISPPIGEGRFEEPGSSRISLRDRLLGVDSSASPFEYPLLALVGRALIFVVLVLLGLPCLFASDPIAHAQGTILHGGHLVIHEAGHIVFGWLGGLWLPMGGTLMQLLFPLICFGALLRRRDPFGASVGLWWFAHSLMDVAPYVNDARAMVLPLLGGGTGQDDPLSHDWYNTLSRLGILTWDHGLAKGFYAMGYLVMGTALIWGGWVLWLQYRNLRERGEDLDAPSGGL